MLELNICVFAELVLILGVFQRFPPLLGFILWFFPPGECGSRPPKLIVMVGPQLLAFFCVCRFLFLLMTIWSIVPGSILYVVHSPCSCYEFLLCMTLTDLVPDILRCHVMYDLFGVTIWSMFVTLW